MICAVSNEIRDDARSTSSSRSPAAAATSTSSTTSGHVIRLDRRLFSATAYPADYGFIPDTLSRGRRPARRPRPPRRPDLPRLLGHRPAGRRVLDGPTTPGPTPRSSACPPATPAGSTSTDLADLPDAPHRRDRALLRGLQGARARASTRTSGAGRASTAAVERDRRLPQALRRHAALTPRRSATSAVGLPSEACAVRPAGAAPMAPARSPSSAATIAHVGRCSGAITSVGQRGPDRVEQQVARLDQPAADHDDRRVEQVDAGWRCRAPPTRRSASTIAERVGVALGGGAR